MLRSVWLLACMMPGDTAGPSAARIENASAQILQTTSSDKARGQGTMSMIVYGEKNQCIHAYILRILVIISRFSSLSMTPKAKSQGYQTAKSPALVLPAT